MAVFTNSGRKWIIDKMVGNVATVQQYIGWGTGTTAEAATQTALVTEDSAGSPAYARATGTVTTQTTTVTGDTQKVVGTIISNGTKTIAEMGLFDATTAGVMLCRAVFTGIPVVLNDSIQGTFLYQQT